MLENTEWAIKNRQSRETGNIGYTRHRTNKCQRIPNGQSKIDNPEKLATQDTQDTGQINVREYQRGDQKWTIQRNWQHRVHKTNKRQRIPKRQSKMDNPEKLATQGTQDEYMLENTEGVFKNGQSRETGNIKMHNTMCVGHHQMETNTNNVNKT